MIRFTRLAGTVAVAALIVAGLAACGEPSGGAAASGTATKCASTQNVNFGYIGDFNGTSLLAIAQDKGMWAAHCLTVTTKVFTNGPLQITALGSGSLDFGYIGPGALWLPAEGKAAIVALDTFTNADRIVALPGRGINSIRELKGKKVGYPTGTSGEMILSLGLKSVGLSMKDIQGVPMDYSTLTSALASGQVDAAGFGYPQLSTVQKQVPNIKILAKDSDFDQSFRFMTAFVTSPGLPKSNPTMVREVIATLKEANDYRYQHRSEAIKLVAQHNNLTVAAVEADAKYDQLEPTSFFEEHTKNGDVDKWLNAFGQYFVTTGTLKEPGDASSYYTSQQYLEAK